jgi:hypothetical protein
MREQRIVKFRCWDKKYSQFSEEPFFRIMISKDGQVYNSENDKWTVHGDRYVIDFWTGLVDSKGVEIYEGDIVSAVGYKPMLVTWNNRFASFCVKNEEWMFQHWFGEAIEGNEVEVIGNIHQHPSLLNTTTNKEI